MSVVAEKKSYPWLTWNYSSRETMQNSEYYAHYVLENEIPGCLIECGTFAGAQLACMQLAILKQPKEKRRKLYGFDSFEGIPWASDEDDQQPGIGRKTQKPYKHRNDLLQSSGVSVCSLQKCNNLIKNVWFQNQDTSNIELIKGWFQHTVEPSKEKVGEIALLRLDGDLYDSTRVCLEAFVPQMSHGAILIVDDWLLTGCRRACDEYFEKIKNTILFENIQPPYAPNTPGPQYFKVIKLNRHQSVARP